MIHAMDQGRSIGWYKGATDQGASNGSESNRMSDFTSGESKEESKERSIREQGIDGRSDGYHTRWIGDQPGSHRISD